MFVIAKMSDIVSSLHDGDLKQKLNIHLQQLINISEKGNLRFTPSLDFKDYVDNTFTNFTDSDLFFLSGLIKLHAWNPLPLTENEKLVFNSVGTNEHVDRDFNFNIWFENIFESFGHVFYCNEHYFEIPDFNAKFYKDSMNEAMNSLCQNLIGVFLPQKLEMFRPLQAEFDTENALTPIYKKCRSEESGTVLGKSHEFKEVNLNWRIQEIAKFLNLTFPIDVNCIATLRILLWSVSYNVTMTKELISSLTTSSSIQAHVNDIKLPALCNHPQRLWEQRMKELTEEDTAIVNRTLHVGVDDSLLTETVIVERFNAPITDRIINCLRPYKMLNDEVINMYFYLLQEYDTELCILDGKRHPSLYLTTFFMNKLRDCRTKLMDSSDSKYDYENVKRYINVQTISITLW
jgi:hypothetical protein